MSVITSKLYLNNIDRTAATARKNGKVIVNIWLLEC
jgi:hypothetical protein